MPKGKGSVIMKAKNIKSVVISALIFGISVQAQEQLVVKKGAKIQSKAVREIVKRKVEHQLFHQRFNIIKNMIYGEKGEAEKQPLFLYKVPHWPPYSPLYTQRDLFQLDLQARGASDLEDVALGQKCVYVKDVLLISKLAQKDLLQGTTPTSNADLALFKAVAGQQLAFDASMWQLAGFFNFGRHFKRGRLSFNVQFPLLMRQNRLRLTNDYTENVQTQVAAQTRSRFASMSLNQFFNEVLQANNLMACNRSTQSGLGDVVTSFYYEVPTKKIERFIAGLKLVFPTSPSCADHVLWPSEIGNGGFAQLGAFISLLHHKNRWVNIHFHGGITGSFGSNQCRRVPKRFSNDDNSACSSGCDPLTGLIFSDGLLPITGASFCELESSIKGFGVEKHKFHIRPGIEGILQIGNMFEQCFFQKGFLDIFYGLRIKGADHIGCIKLNDAFDPSVWRNNSDVIEHKIGGDWSYQYNNQTRFIFGASYIFAGHNEAKIIEGHINFRLEF